MKLTVAVAQTATVLFDTPATLARAEALMQQAAARGARVLVFPEAFIGGPLALVRDGDVIELDVAGRRLHLRVPDEELERRRSALSLSQNNNARPATTPPKLGQIAGRITRQSSVSGYSRK